MIFSWTHLMYGFIGFVVFLLIIAILKSIYLVRQAEVIVIERLGKFNRILHPGLNFTIPFLERPRKVYWSHLREMEHGRFYRMRHAFERIDLREAVYDFPKQSVITKDNVTTEIDAIVYYHIIDPKAAVYEVLDLPEAIEKLAQTTLRALIGSMDLDETLVSRDKINAQLRLILDEATEKWGVNVTRVELQDVSPPAEVKLAMEKQMRAERDRRAAILEAEGKKQAAILEAEGEQESNIRKAKGVAEAKVIKAEAEANAMVQLAKAENQALGNIRKAIPEQDPAKYLLSLQYIKTLPQMTEGKDNKLIVLPYETSGLMGSLSAVKSIIDNVSKS